MYFYKTLSLITVVKNGMPFLKETVECVKNQTLNNIEYIIVYSPSNDGTEEYINQNREKFDVIIYDETSKNKFGSINKGITQAQGDIIGLLHADDILSSDKTLENIIKKFRETNCDLLYGDLEFIDNNYKIKRKWVSSNFYKKNLKYGWMPPHTTMYIRREIYQKNLYSCDFNISGDYEFILRLMKNPNLCTAYINEVICKMRVGGDSTKVSLFFDKFLQDLKIANKYFNIGILVVFLKIIRKFNQLFSK